MHSPLQLANEGGGSDLSGDALVMGGWGLTGHYKCSILTSKLHFLTNGTKTQLILPH